MTEGRKSQNRGRWAGLRNALLVVPTFGVMGVLAGQLASSPIVTIASLIISAAAIGLYFATAFAQHKADPS